MKKIVEIEVGDMDFVLTVRGDRPQKMELWMAQINLGTKHTVGETQLVPVSLSGLIADSILRDLKEQIKREIKGK